MFSRFTVQLGKSSSVVTASTTTSATLEEDFTLLDVGFALEDEFFLLLEDAGFALELEAFTLLEDAGFALELEGATELLDATTTLLDDAVFALELEATTALLEAGTTLELETTSAEDDDTAKETKLADTITSKSGMSKEQLPSVRVSSLTQSIEVFSSCFLQTLTDSTI